MTQVNFRIDDEIKANAEKALNDMGLTMSAAITMFLVKVGRERRIPFEIKAGDELTSAERIAAFRNMREWAETGNTPDLTLEEINEEIKKSRAER